MRDNFDPASDSCLNHHRIVESLELPCRHLFSAHSISIIRGPADVVYCIILLSNVLPMWDECFSAGRFLFVMVEWLEHLTELNAYFGANAGTLNEAKTMFTQGLMS